MVLPQLRARQANRQTRGTSMHSAQRIMVNKDKYPHMMGSNPAQCIAVVKCHIHPLPASIKQIHQLQPAPPNFPCSHPSISSLGDIHSKN